MNFREKIKLICTERGMTQKDLAHKLGITDISLNKSLRGEYPQLQTLERIASALGVPLTDLFEPPPTDVMICPKCGTKFKMEE